MKTFASIIIAALVLSPSLASAGDDRIVAGADCKKTTTFDADTGAARTHYVCKVSK
jgi:hypothetical protein